MRKPTLSPTRLSTYLACPVRYRWSYVDPRGKWYVRAKPYFSFGVALHQVLQRFHDSADKGVDSVDQAINALEESWIDAGYSSQEEMMQALAEGKEIVASHIHEHTRKVRPGTTLYLEKAFRKEYDRFILLGRIDRVIQHDDGSLEIVDYKTGSRVVSEASIKSDLAMGIYQLLLRNKHPEEPIRATIEVLTRGDTATASLSDEELAEFEQSLIPLAHEILDRDYENLEPQVKRLCVSCDFVPLCRKWPEYAEQFAEQNSLMEESVPASET